MKRSAAAAAVDTMWSTSSHFRQTRKGKVIKAVKENYLRDDIFFGTQVSASGDGMPISITTVDELLNILHHPSSSSSSTNSLEIIVVDTNVLLHNMDLIEHAAYRSACPNIVIPQTALLECKRNSMPIYGRAVDLLKDSKRCAIFFANEHHVECQLSSKDINNDSNPMVTVNDRNDAFIRLVAEYFGSQLKTSDGDNQVKVILLTDDADCRRRATLEQEERFGSDFGGAVCEARSVKRHVQEIEKNDKAVSLQDLVAQFNIQHEHLAKKQKSQVFQTHESFEKIMLGVKSAKYFQGTLRCERGTYQRCYVNIRRGEDRVAVIIQGMKDMNRAVDGDTVAIQLHSIDHWICPNSGSYVPKNDKVGIANETAEPNMRDENNVEDTVLIPGAGIERKPTGKVIGIIRRQFHRDFCGSIYTRTTEEVEDEGSKIDVTNQFVSSEDRDRIAQEHEIENIDGSISCVVFPAEKKIPPIIIRTTQRSRLIGKRILVSIDSWPANSAFPLGHYVRTIGINGDKEVETEVLLHEHNIPCEPFSTKVLACLPPEDYKIDLSTNPDRKDLRNLPVLSIDPPGCKDIDDALHCIVLENGNWQIGVHIADVTHYVEAGSPLDNEAANRSTSTYLIARRLDMLPSLLTTDLCSLKGNVDRYEFFSADLLFYI